MSVPHPQEPGSTSAPATDRFRPDLEGLRGVAIAAVVLFHVGIPWVPGGFVGVDVFFVLSGFLITGLIVREIGETGSLSFSRFYDIRTSQASDSSRVQRPP